MMTFDERKTLGMKFGTARLSDALKQAGYVGNTRYVHVAGTNGKGSVCRMAASILSAAGYRAGLFTSPSVTDLLDDITVNGTAISPAAFERYVARLAGCEKPDDPLSYFEMETGAALLYFEEQQVDVAIIECGLGGLQDATNVIPPPVVAVITAVSLDHTDLLGDTVEQITENKCGIIKPPCVVITSPAQHPDALATILMTAAAKGLTVHMPAVVTDIVQTANMLTFAAGGERYAVSAGGQFQADNAMLAVEIAHTLRQNGLMISNEAICAGLRNTAFPCRQEFVCRAPIRLMDGGHNPAGIAALAESLTAWDIPPLTAVIGMLADKDVTAAVRILTPHIQKAVCCTPPNPRALSAEALGGLFRQAGVPTEIVPDPVAAWNFAEQIAGKQPLMVAGSFYLCAAIRPHLCEKYKN